MTVPPAVYELVAAPLAFALAALHAGRALGPRRAAAELLALAAYGYLLERAAIAAFASHEYGTGWLLAPGGVPVAVAATWAAVIVSAMALAARLRASPLARAAGAGLVGIALDLLMEPVAVRAGLWTWTPPGPWLGVPVGNFVGWAVIVGGWTLGTEREGGAGSPGEWALRRLGLGAVSVAGLLGVGVVWRALDAERVFAGAGGWLAGAAFLAATAAIAGRRVRPAGSGAGGAGLAARLGDAGGARPAAVLLLLAALFAADALGTGDLRLAAVALGSVGVLLLLALRAST